MNLKQKQEELNELISKMEVELRSDNLDNFNQLKERHESLEKEIREYKDGLELKIEKNEVNKVEKELRSLISNGQGSITLGTRVDSEILKHVIEGAEALSQVKVQPVNAVKEVTFLEERDVLQGEKVNEGEAVSESDGVTLIAHKVTPQRHAVATVLSKDLILTSVVDMESYVAELIGRRLSKSLIKELAEKLVAFKDSTVIESQVAEVVTIDDLINMTIQYPDVENGSACFMMNREQFKNIAVLKDGNGKPFLTKEVIDGKIQYKLLGYQMVIIPTLENIMFGDLNKVVRLVVHQGVSVKVSSDFENDKKGLVPFVGDVYANIVLVSNSIVKLKVKAEG